MSGRRRSNSGAKKATPQKKTADSLQKSTDPEQIAFWDSVSTILKSNIDELLPRHSTIYKHKLDEKEKRLEETDEEREELLKSQKTKLQANFTAQLYFSMSSFNTAKEEPINLRIPAPQVDEDKVHLTSAEEERLAKIMKKSKLENIEKELTVPVPISKSEKKRLARQKREKTAGPNWFGLSAPEMTDELKQDMQILNLRNYVDPSDIYRRPEYKEMPKYFEVGTVVENAADFYSGRVARKERKQHFVDEVLSDQKYKQYAKRKYREMHQKTENSRKRQKTK
jgi:hypothetical protein